MAVFEQQTRLLEDPLLAGGINVDDDVLDGQDGSETVH